MAPRFLVAPRFLLDSRFLVAIVAIIVVSEALANGALPRDVSKFVARRDMCDHFRDEYSYDEERRQMLDTSLRKYCVGTDNQLATLKGKYRADRAVMAKLNEYESSIESYGKSPSPTPTVNRTRRHMP